MTIGGGWNFHLSFTGPSFIHGDACQVWDRRLEGSWFPDMGDVYLHLLIYSAFQLYPTFFRSAPGERNLNKARSELIHGNLSLALFNQFLSEKRSIFVEPLAGVVSEVSSRVTIPPWHWPTNG